MLPPGSGSNLTYGSCSPLDVLSTLNDLQSASVTLSRPLQDCVVLGMMFASSTTYKCCFAVSRVSSWWTCRAQAEPELIVRNVAAHC